ncbi:MAG TPA: class I SAM-dependent methyltransferase [bacterium]|jgi:SAM-dependent methyltransferase
MCAKESSEWYARWFDEDYLALYAHRDVKEAQDFVEIIWASLELRPGITVADVPCGAGRHSLAFAQKGARVIGVDLSSIMLARAEEVAEVYSLPPLFVRGDIRHLPLAAEYDVVANIFSSLGYFDSEADNHAAFSELVRILAPGGILILDVINPNYLRSHFIAHTHRETRDGEMSERRELDRERKRVIKHIEIQHGSVTRKISESVRLYESQELEQMAEDRGLSVVELWGDYDGKPFVPQSPRLILFARK